jgi:hypothetical protein
MEQDHSAGETAGEGPERPQTTPDALHLARARLLWERRQVRAFARRTVGVTVELHYPGSRPPMTQPDDDPGLGTAAAVVHLQSPVRSSPEFRRLEAHEAKIRRYQFDVRLCQLQRGLSVIPLPLADEVGRQLAAMHDEFWSLVEVFLVAYAAWVGQAKPPLAPPVDQLRRGFHMEFRFQDITTPNRLQRISLDLYRREAAKMHRLRIAAIEGARRNRRQGMADAVDGLVTALPPSAGRRKHLREVLLTNLQHFLDHFAVYNVTKDRALAGLVRQVSAILRGVDLRALRRDEPTRTRVREHLEEVYERIQSLLAAPPQA